MKKAIALILLMLMVLGTFGGAAASEQTTQGAAQLFSDINSDDWYEQYIDVLVAKDYAKGMGDGTFGIGLTVKNCEIITFLLRIIGEVPVDTTFDASMGEAWYTPYYRRAMELSIVDEEELVKAENGATRIEVAVLMYRALKVTNKDFQMENKLKLPENYTESFSDMTKLVRATYYYRDIMEYDVDNTPEKLEFLAEHMNSINFMYNRGLLQGDTYNNSNPNDLVKREEVGTILARILDKQYRDWCVPFVEKEQEQLSFGVVVLNSLPTAVTEGIRYRQMAYAVPVYEMEAFFNPVISKNVLNKWYGNYGSYSIVVDNEVNSEDEEKRIRYLGTTDFSLTHNYAMSKWNGEQADIYVEAMKEERLKALYARFNYALSEVKLLTDSPLLYETAVEEENAFRYVMYYKTSDLANCNLNTAIAKPDTWYEVVFDIKGIGSDYKYFAVGANEVQLSN